MSKEILGYELTDSEHREITAGVESEFWTILVEKVFRPMMADTAEGAMRNKDAEIGDLRGTFRTLENLSGFKEYFRNIARQEAEQEDDDSQN